MVDTTSFIWSVFIEGTEVNDYYMRLYDAEELAEDYKQDGYTGIELISTDNKIIEYGSK